MEEVQIPNYSKMSFPYIAAPNAVDSKQINSPFSLSTGGSTPSSPNQHAYEMDKVHNQHSYVQQTPSNYSQECMISPYTIGNSQNHFTFDPSDSSIMNSTQLSSQNTNDPKYFERRKKNNEASKKSRAKKKEHAKEMENKARALEDENRELKIKQEQLQREIAGYKQQLSDQSVKQQQIVPTESPTHHPNMFSESHHLSDYYNSQQQHSTLYTTH